MTTKKVPRARVDSDVLNGWLIEYDTLKKIQNGLEDQMASLEQIESIVIVLRDLGFVRVEKNRE